MPQTSFAIDHVEAFAGMLAEGNFYAQIEAYVAGEDIPAGRAVEVNTSTGKVQLCQSTGQEVTTLAGISIYQDMKSPGVYAAGTQVPVLRKGIVWVDFVGTGATALEDAKISHSSTVATNRGMFTDNTSSATAGSEVTSAVGKFRAGIGTTLAKVEINLP